jgi:hypothetical protein
VWGVVEEGDGYVAGIFFEWEVEAESAVEFLGGHAFAKASVKFLHVGAGGDLPEEIPSDYFLPDEAGERLFIGVIAQHDAFGIDLDDSVREGVQLGVADGVDGTRNESCGQGEGGGHKGLLISSIQAESSGGDESCTKVEIIVLTSPVLGLWNTDSFTNGLTGTRRKSVRWFSA